LRGRSASSSGRSLQRNAPTTSVTAIRLAAELAAAIDAWAAANEVSGRSEARRQLVELGHKAKRRTGR
jgi:hypothetical protein